ncbi:hypothetical protein [Corynebacterium sp. AOP12-C2-36]|uniref:hypothetical protein n=1 Tax=Corynebacterium sp. AOP12-C2-36 TaxID=3457723 RepID=UPI0040348510
MTHTTSSTVFSAVQQLLDTAVLSTTAPWDQERLEHLAGALAPQWEVAISTDNVAIAAPAPPRSSGFSPTVVAYGHHCSSTAHSTLPTALSDALRLEATSPLYRESSATASTGANTDTTASMSATYTTDNGHEAAVTEYLYHDTDRDVVWAVVATNAEREGTIVLNALREHPAR